MDELQAVSDEQELRLALTRWEQPQLALGERLYRRGVRLGDHLMFGSDGGA